MLKLMYITNRPEVAKIAEAAGVERIFVDMEYLWKSDRQGGMNTVQNRHTTEDVKRLREVLTSAELLTRINPIHEEMDEIVSSKEEIDGVIEAGADIIMLPYFKTAEEVRTFIRLVDGRARTMLLLETPEAVEVIDEILEIRGIDEIHVGLNDLSLGYGKKFMFEVLADGTVDQLCGKFKASRTMYGFGGIAAPGKGLLPAELILMEHYRLGSGCVILSRSFCNPEEELDVIENIFREGIPEIRQYEERYMQCEVEDFEENRKLVAERVQMICEKIN